MRTRQELIALLQAKGSSASQVEQRLLADLLTGKQVTYCPTCYVALYDQAQSQCLCGSMIQTLEAGPDKQVIEGWMAAIKGQRIWMP